VVPWWLIPGPAVKGKTIARSAIVDDFAQVNIYIDIHIASDAAKADIDALEES
jgi:hypothetical protein